MWQLIRQPDTHKRDRDDDWRIWMVLGAWQLIGDCREGRTSQFLGERNQFVHLIV